MLGASRLGDEVVKPLTSSSNSPCSRNLSAIGCTTLGNFSGSICCSSPLMRLLISATGKGNDVSPYLFLSSASRVFTVLPAMAGTMWLILTPGTQANQNPAAGSPFTNNTNTLTPTSGGTNHMPYDFWVSLNPSMVDFVPSFLPINSKGVYPKNGDAYLTIKV